MSGDLRAVAERGEAQAVAAVERLNRDYLEGTLSAARFEVLVVRAEAEQAAAAGAAEQARQREQEVRDAVTLPHQVEALHRQLLAPVRTAETIGALRRVFASFSLARLPIADDEPIPFLRNGVTGTAEIIESGAPPDEVVPRWRGDACAWSLLPEVRPRGQLRRGRARAGLGADCGTDGRPRTSTIPEWTTTTRRCRAPTGDPTITLPGWRLRFDVRTARGARKATAGWRRCGRG
jgi:hypothetical protein